MTVHQPFRSVGNTDTNETGRQYQAMNSFGGSASQGAQESLSEAGRRMWHVLEDDLSVLLAGSTGGPAAAVDRDIRGIWPVLAS